MTRATRSLPDALPERIEVDASVVRILERLERAGYETWCVGGAIRDALLGEPHQDVDLATAATPDAVQQLFRRTVPVGLAHGTVGVLDDDDVLHEVTTFRRDVHTDGRHAVVEFGTSLRDDLDRRDFTINAIAYHPLRHEWNDPHAGFADLRAGIIRAVGAAAVRFREDRLRILRALRFAARWDFTIESDTWRAACGQSADTVDLSAERVRDEWVKSLRTAATVDGLVRAWLASGVASVWMPECNGAVAERQVGADTADARDPVLVTAYYCAPSAPVWRRFKGSTAEIARAAAIDDGPGTPGSADAVTVRRWMARVGAAASDLQTLARWRTPRDSWLGVMDDILARGDATSRAQLAVTGDDLAGAGIRPGPGMGHVLSTLLDAVLEDPALNARDRLMALAARTAHDE